LFTWPIFRGHQFALSSDVFSSLDRSSPVSNEIGCSRTRLQCLQRECAGRGYDIGRFAIQNNPVSKEFIMLRPMQELKSRHSSLFKVINHVTSLWQVSMCRKASCSPTFTVGFAPTREAQGWGTGDGDGEGKKKHDVCSVRGMNFMCNDETRMEHPWLCYFGLCQLRERRTALGSRSILALG
jgi:hypothetical protein